MAYTTRPDENETHLRKLQTLGLLVGGLSHDLNNILAVIDGYAGILTRQLADPKMQAKLQAITGATARAAELTRSMLAYRDEKIPQNRCDIGAVIRQTEVLMNTILGSRINLVLRLPTKPQYVAADNDRVTEILLHLAFYAKKAVHRGAVTLSLVAHAESVLLLFSPGAHQASAGLVAQSLAGGTLWQPDVRPDVEACSGLALAAGLVTHLGGTLRLVQDTEPASGNMTALALSFPCAADREDEAPDDGAACLAGKTVLVVDDEEALHPVLEDQLQHLGMRVLKAANADMALGLQRDYDGVIDVLLTDVVMPDTDGFKLATLMMDARPEISVVYMSGHGDAVRHMHFAAHLPEDARIMSKPFNEAHLSNALNAALADLGRL